jgi:predicted metal-binding membrane protein
MSTPAQPEVSKGLFVGRQRDLGELRGALELAANRRGSLVLVTGEAGVGKTRLLEELTGSAARDGWTVLVGRCWEQGGAPAYGVIWTAFGVLAFAGDAVVHQIEHDWAWLHERPHVIAGATLLLAGAFQFSDLKDRCLRQCRHPALFLQHHYQRGVGAAFALGRRHGLFCVGCCWALMLVMFAVGIANLAWMAPFALIMLYEKAGLTASAPSPPSAQHCWSSAPW